MSNIQNEVDRICEAVRTGGMSYEEANKQFEALGVNLRFDPDRPVDQTPMPGTDEQGYIPAEGPSEDAQRKVDMTRRTDLKNQQAIQKVNGRKFIVSYDDLGYAMSAVRVYE